MRFFIALGSLVVVLLLAILIVPYFVDWTAFRDDFEREASRLLGQPVTVRGEASARLLPFPSLTFEDVVIGGEREDEPSLTLASFSMDAELAPYVSGEIRIFQMRLEEPHLIVPLGAGGESGSPALPAREAIDSTVILENVEISGGRITFVSEGGAARREIGGIEAELSARTLSGPFTGGGRMVADGEPLTFSLSSGTIGEDGVWPFRLTLSSDRLAASFGFDGTTTLRDGEPDFTGALEIVSPIEPSVEPGVLPPVRVASAIEISRREARLTEARVEVGAVEAPYVLSGEGRVDLAGAPTFDLTLRGEQVDVDSIAEETTVEGEAVTFADRADAVRRTLAAIPDIGMDGEVELTLPVVIAGDTTIRNSSFVGSPTGEGWEIARLSAELPGRTLLEASGYLAVEDELAFAGDLLLASRQPGGFSNWMSGAIDPKLAALERAGFAAKVRLSAGGQTLEDLEIDVGGQRLFGRLERSGTRGARTINADLSGQAVDLDGFIAFAELFTETSDIFEPVEALDIRFDAGPVAYDELEAHSFGIDFAYADGLLDLRSLVTRGLAGTDLEARGTIGDLWGDPRPDLAFDLSAQDPTRVIGLVEKAFPGSAALEELAERAGRLGPLKLTGTTSLPVEDGAPALALHLSGEADGTSINLALALENGLAAATVDGRFGFETDLVNEDPLVLLGQLGLEGIDLGVPAPLALDVKMSGVEGRAVVGSATLRAPGSEISANGSLTLSAAGIDEADLAVRARSDDASPWLSAAGLGLGQGLDTLPADLSGRLSWFRGDWVLSDMKGLVAGSSVDTTLRATQAGGIDGAVRLSGLSLPWLATLVYGSDPLAGTLDSPWPDQPFGTSLLAGVPLAIDLEAARLEAGEDLRLSDFSARLEGGEGFLYASNATGRLAGGVVRASAELRNSGGFGSLVLDLSLDDASLGAEPVNGPLAGILSGIVSLEGSGRSYAELIDSLTGSGQAELAQASLDGVAPGQFPEILRRSEAEGFAVTSRSVGEMLAALNAGGSYPLGTIRSPIEVALGVARFSPAPIAARSDEMLTASGAIDLSGLTVEASVTLAYLPSEDNLIEDTAPAVSYRMEGPIGSPIVLANVEPLTSYLTVRNLRREEERLEALREDLRETLRLRREARLYEARQAERQRLAAEAAAAAEAERIRAEQEAAAAAERAREEEAERARQAEAERARQAEAERAAAAERAASEARPPAPSVPPLSAPPASSPPLDFDLSPPTASNPAGRDQPEPAYENLPGVRPPLDF